MSFTVTVKRNKRVDLSKVQTSLRGPSKVAVGFPAGESDGENIQKAIWQEFGTKGGAASGGWGGPIPERPFMRNTMRDNQSTYRNAMKAEAKPLLLAQTSLGTVLAKLGALAARDVQAEIAALSSPPNSPVTIELKGSANPLIDSGEMRRDVKWKIIR
ncbi:hypothetical protein MNR02_06640 [Shinella sp. H4-D48]|uniref:hypothetical protein n=1 Tax=Shinella sp. H4-D48 TaxID=2925841 RepID=UPI001F531FBF|nr:hypothetical protein [Shinella sp. H4-D48]UNK39379.1 hypothetical protein MNR02_06640 [Shinella sp. H4-D48]